MEAMFCFRQYSLKDSMAANANLCQFALPRPLAGAILAELDRVQVSQVNSHAAMNGVAIPVAMAASTNSNVPVARGIDRVQSLDDLRDFFRGSRLRDAERSQASILG